MKTNSLHNRILSGVFLMGAMLIFRPEAVKAQSIRNMTVTVEDGKAIIVYDLVIADIRQKANLQLFTSADGFTTALRAVSGDVGSGISAGAGKKIVWDALRESGTFEGELTFKIKGSLIPLPITVFFPIKGSHIKSGKSSQIQWEGGRPGEKIRIDVLQNGQLVEELASVPNTGKFDWNVPKKFPKGKYILRLSSGIESVTTSEFKNSAGIPKWIFALPVLGLLGAASGNGSSDLLLLPAPPDPN